jgi:hypothetical protein
VVSPGPTVTSPPDKSLMALAWSWCSDFWSSCGMGLLARAESVFEAFR